MAQRFVHMVIVLFGVISVVPPVSADAGRYTMSQTENGFLRLDTETGAVAICEPQDAAWACRDVADNTRGLADKLAKLRQENTRLQERIAKLERGGASEPGLDDRAGPPPPPRMWLPSEEEIDRAVTFLDRMLKRFKGIVEDLKSGRDKDGMPL